MVAVNYRYKAGSRTTLAELSRFVPGALVLGPVSPAQYVDVTCDDTVKSDLDDFMLAKGYTFFATAPTSTPAQSSAGDDANRRLLEKFVNAPAEGWPSNIFREVTGGVFPTAVTWWTTSAKTTKIMEAVYTRNAAQQATTVVWRMFATDGTTVLATITDTITYSAGIEASRTRVIA